MGRKRKLQGWQPPDGWQRDYTPRELEQLTIAAAHRGEWETLRRMKGYSRSECAFRMGVDDKTLYRFETHQGTPERITIYKWGFALRVPMAVLLHALSYYGFSVRLSVIDQYAMFCVCHAEELDTIDFLQGLEAIRMKGGGEE